MSRFEFWYAIVVGMILGFLIGVYMITPAKAETTLGTLQRHIDMVEVGKPQKRDHWSKEQREAAEIVDRINKMQPNKKPRTDLIRDFGRNGIDIIQEYR